MTKTYITPPGDLLTGSPRIVRDIPARGKIADFITRGGIPCTPAGLTVAPQLAKYDFKLMDIYQISKLKRLLPPLQARFGAGLQIMPGGAADFSVILPLDQRRAVYLRDCIYTPAFNDSSRSSAVLGIDTDNHPVLLDVAKAPHTLIAGVTGSGKSVLLNSIICSLLYKSTHGYAQFVMIDPKQVELSVYDNIPLLYTPIARGPAAALQALQTICNTMDQRYTILSRWGLKDAAGVPDMPLIYVVIDELADLMLTARAPVESAIIRIAQLGRAAGIHLIVATQRPTAQIITGLIRANIPCKIALTVSNTTDSVVVLGHKGAEKLQGRGDMLLKLPNQVQEIRLQAAFTPDQDIKAITDYWRQYN